MMRLKEQLPVISWIIYVQYNIRFSLKGRVSWSRCIRIRNPKLPVPRAELFK